MSEQRTVVVGAGLRARVLALVEARVRVRFELTAAAFTDALVDRLRRQTPPSGDPAEFVRRLALDDLYLASACALGDERAWGEFTRAYTPFAREFARRFLAGPDADDLVDQTIAVLWEHRKLARYDGRSTLKTWLGVVVANAALNVVKLERRTVSLEWRLERQGQLESGNLRAVEPLAAEHEQEESARLLAALVARAVAGLPVEDRLLLLLYYEEGLTLEEIERILHLSKASLSRRLRRAREQVRQVVEREARAATGSSADALRHRIDLGRLEFDLSASLGNARAARDSLREADLKEKSPRAV